MLLYHIPSGSVDHLDRYCPKLISARNVVEEYVPMAGVIRRDLCSSCDGTAELCRSSVTRRLVASQRHGLV